jgi:hypothetical protein
MSSVDRIEDHASGLVSAARAVQEAAGQPRGSAASTALLASMSEALQALSASWYSLAADAAPRVAMRRRLGRASRQTDVPVDEVLSREEEVHLVATLHDVAAAFAGCARACREARSTVAPLVERSEVERFAKEGLT